MISGGLKLLPCAKEIINTSSTIQNVTVKGKRKFYVLEAMMAIADGKEKVLRKVRVVLVEDKKVERLTLRCLDLSVMESKNSLVPQK